MLLRPTRNAAEEYKSVKIVADFDAYIEKEVGFIFKGKQYIFERATVRKAMQITVANNELQQIIISAFDKKVTEDELLKAFYNLFHLAVPNLTYQDVEKMDLMTLNSIQVLIAKHCVADASLYDEDEKKNPLKRYLRP